MKTRKGRSSAELVRQLQAEYDEASALIKQCQSGSTGYFWCQGRIGTASLVLLRCGYEIADKRERNSEQQTNQLTPFNHQEPS
jgi:hypothetical protein